MIKVRATNAYKENNIIDAELKIIPEEGYEFEVSKERYEILTKNNEHNLKFVEEIKENKDKSKDNNKDHSQEGD